MKKINKPRKSKRPPLLKDKETASKITADPKQLQDFFMKCFQTKKKG